MMMLAPEAVDIRHVQELLGLLGLRTEIDGGMGPATQSLLKRFQAGQRLPAHGIPDQPTLEALERETGIQDARHPPFGRTRSGCAEALHHILTTYHLPHRPREVGRDCHGPWVRLYMDGREGLPWSVGFVSTLLRQAAQALGKPPQIRGGWSPTILAQQAKEAGLLVDGDHLSGEIPRGSIFLTRHGSLAKWVNTGVVLEDRVAENAILTAEATTNDFGRHEGWEVSQLVRRRSGRDYIIFRPGDGERA